MSHSIRILGHDCFVDPDAAAREVSTRDRDIQRDSRKVIDITWLGETHHGVDEYICLSLACSSDSELSMSAVHRVTSLESDNFPPCELLEMCAQFRWGVYTKRQYPNSLNIDYGYTTQGDIVKVGGQLDCLDFSTDIVVVYTIVKVRNSRMCTIVCSKHLLGLFDLVWSVNILDCRVSVPMLSGRNTSGPPVMTARGASSRGSRNASRTPGLMPSLLMSVSETSRLIGIEKSVPSTSLSFSTTLTNCSVLFL